MTEPLDTSAPVVDENRLIAERRSKLDRLRENGIAYPNDFRPDAHAAELHSQYGEQDKDALAATNKVVKVAGRMMLKRVMGKASFATLQDASGRIQIYLDKAALGEENYAEFKGWDIGDILAVRDHDHTQNRGYREGAITIGIINHADSFMTGHGPGVMDLLSCATAKIEPVIDKRANLAVYLGIGNHDWAA